MRERELSKLIEELGRLTPQQRRQVAVELHAGENKASAVAVIEKNVADKARCPHCESEKVVRNGMSDGLQRFNLKNSVVRRLRRFSPIKQQGIMDYRPTFWVK